MIAWIAAHWASIVSVTAAVVFVWRAGKFFTQAILSVQHFFANLTRGLDLLVRVDRTATLLATNHLPHIQAEIEKANLQLPIIHEEMQRTTSQAEGLRSDFRSLTLALLARKEQ